MVDQVLEALACQQNDCDGQIAEGYCDVCGLAASSAISPSFESQIAGGSAQQLRQFQRDHPNPSHTSHRFSSRTASRTFSRSSLRMSSRRSDRNSLGLGLVSLPDLPSTEPENLVLTDPKVPENKRFCGHCDARVRRDRGFCSQCGQRYSFIPSLQAGDVVAGQYEVKGAIAYGGLGWIYLAFDSLLSRYVILKGLLNSEDESSAAVALAERQFLAAVKHPNIVGVYNFVSHNGEGFIVMEYVAGQTLRDIRRARGPLPVSEAIAYIHRILAAFGYLHDQGLVYCDFKPDNIMLEGGDIKLIDMGAVRQIDDPEGDIYGTVGYSAPEAGEGPTVVSDLFTVGRTLAVLVATIPDFSKGNRFTLPGPEQISLFGQFESLYQFLLRATAKEPSDRFQSAEDMAEQLLGVLFQVVAQENQHPVQTRSRLFGADPTPRLSYNPESPLTASSTELPRLLLDETDPADAVFVQIRTHLEASNLESLNRAEQQLQSHCSQGSMQVNDWRSHWYWGILRLHQVQNSQDPNHQALNHQAYQHLQQVYIQLPGELTTQMGFAIACECLQKWDQAIALYQRIWQTDRQYLAAVFGLARCWQAKGDRTQAASLLNQILENSPLYHYGRWEMSQILMEQIFLGQSLQKSKSPQQTSQSQPLISWKQAAQLFVSTTTGSQQMALTEREARFCLERALRNLAQSMTGRTRLELVEQANQIRPQTLW